MINVTNERGISIAAGKVVDDVLYFVSYTHSGLFMKSNNNERERCIAKLEYRESQKLYYDSVVFGKKIFFIPNYGNNRLLIYDTQYRKLRHFDIELRRYSGDFVMHFVDGNILNLVTNERIIQFDMRNEDMIDEIFLNICVGEVFDGPDYARVLRTCDRLWFCPYSFDRIATVDMLTMEVEYSSFCLKKKAYFSLVLAGKYICWIPSTLKQPVISYDTNSREYAVHDCYRGAIDDVFGSAFVDEQQHIILVPAIGKNIVRINTSFWNAEIVETLGVNMEGNNLSYYRSSEISDTARIFLSSCDNIPCLKYESGKLSKWEIGERADELALFLEFICL